MACRRLGLDTGVAASRFANDVRRELLAVGPRAPTRPRRTVEPGEWLPPGSRYRCTYVRKYLRVAVAWDLSITGADDAAIRQDARGCA